MKAGIKLKIIAVAVGVFAIGFNLKAEYDPTIGRFLSRDPIDEPGFRAIVQSTSQATGDVTLLNMLVNRDDEPENKKFEPEYVFVNNNPINSWDYLGLTVTARFNNSKQRLSIVDDNKGGAIAVKAFSGGEWKNGKFVPRTILVSPYGKDKGLETRLLTYQDTKGPTIPGTYYLGKAINGRANWYVLLDKTTLRAAYAFGRFGFYLHMGHVSEGCITVPEEDAMSNAGWARIVNMIETTKTMQIERASLLKGHECIEIYGEITVTE